MAILAQLSSLRREVFFLDATLSDLATLTSSLPVNAEIHLIDPKQDGLEQIALMLQGLGGIDVIHLFSHGSAGALQLGSTTLSGSTINNYSATLSQIGASLSPTGDILLYGCNVGAGAEGQAYVDSIARLTQADVAASDDVTGSAVLGGDWVLEVQSGAVDAAAVSAVAYAGALANAAPTLTAFSAAVDTTIEDSVVEITFADLAAKGNEADADGTVDAFVVKSVSNGSLKIGADAASATPFAWATNTTIDAAHHAYWMPDANSNGTLNMLSVVAKDNNGAESVTPVQATVNVTAVNDAPTLTRWQTLSFAEKVDYAAGSSPSAVKVTDVNNDGTNDLVVANSGSNTVSVFLFDSRVSYATGSSPSSVTATDVNGDGLVDLIVANQGSSTVSVLLNKGDGLFAEKVDYETGASPSSVIASDVNGDGKVDLVVANRYSSTVSVLLNNGGGTYAAKVDYGTGYYSSSVTASDVNGDGKVDLLVANRDSDTVSVLLNKGDGTYATKVDYGTGSQPSSVTASDVNGDGKVDLLVANQNGSSNTVSVLLNNGDGTYVAKVDYAAGVTPVSVTAGDVNGDGKVDLLVANQGSNNVSVLLNKGDGIFSPKVDYAAGSGPSSVTASDADGDGKVDLVVANRNSGTVSVLYNTSAITITPVLFTEQTPKVIFGDIVVFDNDGSGDWNGGGLTVKITNNGEVADSLSVATSNPGGNGIWVNTIDKKLMSGAMPIGIVDALSVSGNSAWHCTFNTRATNVLVEKVARAVLFNNSSSVVSNAERTVAFTVSDKYALSSTIEQNIAIVLHPTLTTFSGVFGTITEDSQATPFEITFDALKARGNEADANGTVDAFVVKSVSNGSLKIGADAASATPFAWATNTTIDAAHHAYWVPDANANGTLKMLSVVAKDNSGYESLTPVQATVNVTAVNDAPTLTRWQTLSFAEKVDYAAGSSPSAVTITDVNNDGEGDLVVANSGSNTVSVTLFDSRVSYPTGISPSSVTATDVNGDGLVDLVVANSGSNTVSALLNKGDGQFAAKVDYATGAYPSSVTASDVNGDGKVDLLVANQNSHTVSVLLNNGDGTYAAKVDYGTGSTPSAVTASDVNGDGKVDLLVANRGDIISVLLNKGDGTYAAKVDYGAGRNPSSVTASDVNSDGKVDLLVANQDSWTMSVLLNNGDGTYAAKVDYETGHAPSSVTASDVNGDGKVDLIFADSDYWNSAVSVFLNKGDGTFSPKVDYAAGSQPSSVTASDADGDGKVDLVVANRNSGTVSVLYNTSAIAITPVLFTEQTPTVIFGDIVVADNDGSGDWNGGGLTVKITNNGEVADSLSVATSNFGGNGIWVNTNDKKLMSGSTPIGIVDALSVSGNNAWHCAFNSFATNVLVEKVARAILFNNSSANPGKTERSVTMTVTDNHNASTSIVQSVIIQLVNAAPTFTAFSNAVDTTNEDTAVLITLSDLLAHGDEADRDGAVNAFIVKSLSSGTLKIGVDAATASAWSSAVNNTLDATHHAWWMPGRNSNGTLDAFTVVARDNQGATSTTAVQATVTVVPVNDAPTMQWQPTASFTAKPAYATTGGPTVVTAGDFNGDGLVDLAIANTDYNTVSIRLNNGNGTFSNKMDTPAGSQPYAMTSADFNGDNKADLVVVNRSSHTISFLADGIAAKVDYATGSYPVSVTYADVNGDGKLDLVVANEGSGNVSVLTNQGYGTFATKVDYAVGSAPRSVITADINSDGRADLVVANYGSNTISILLNNGDGTFATKKDYSTGDGPVSVTAADFNGDGYTDLAVANAIGNTVSLFLNNSDGTFAIHGISTTGTTPDSLTSADFNNDGNIDLAVVNTAGQTISLLMNQGDGSFTEKVDISVGATPRSIISGDFDGDGKADLAVVNSGNSTLSVLINSTQPVDFTSFARKTAVPVAGNIIINDGDGDADWNGGTLKAQITANAETADYLTLPTANPGGNGIWLDTNGNKLMAGTTNIGTADAATVSNNSAWMLTFNENATNNLVQSVARAISIINSPDAQNVIADMINRTITLTATDRGGNSAFAVLHHSDNIVGNEFGVNPADVTPPLLESFVQAAATNGIAATSNLELIFNETIQRGNGLIEIHSGSETGALVASYDAASSTNISISDKTLTINPSADLQNGTHYFVTFDAGAIKDRAGNSYAGNDVCHVKTEGVGPEYHNLTGDVTFWKNGHAVDGVTTTLTSQPTTQLVELRNMQLAADGSRTVEIWTTATTVNSLQLEFVLPTGSKASWQSDTGLPAEWTLLANSELDGQFILGGMSTTALASGAVKLGTLALTATTTPQHAEFFLSKGFVGHNTVPAFGIALESITSGNSANYQHLGVLEGDYTLAGTKAGGTAEHNAVDANDALAALKMAVALNPNDDGSAVSSYQFLAADINHDGKVRSNDALSILKMAVKLSSAPASEWIFTTENAAESSTMDRSNVDWSHVIPTVNLDNDVSLDLIGIVKGDVDGSWAA